MSATIRVTLRPRTTLQISIRPRPRLLTVLRTGTTGLRGLPGTDAAVTTENIEAALGFAPVSPSALDTAIAALSSVYQTASQVASQIASALTTYATQSWVSTAISNAISSLGLGSASTHPASDFATAAQGAKADTALQDPSAFDPAGSAAAAAAASIPLTQKGAANGVATLGSDSRIPAAQLPSYMDLVEEFASFSALPATGATGTIYVTKDTNKIYRWSGSTYVEISPSPGSTDSVTEGSVNLYFTAARAVSALASTLASYATTAWVTAQNYATQSWVSSSISSAIAALGLGTASTHAASDFDSAGSASSAQAYAIQRANHTGTQPASTVTGIAKQVFQGFSVSTFDTSIPTFSGGVLTLFTLKSGGASGMITNTIAYNYSGGLLTSKVLKDPSGATLNTITFSYSGTTLTSKILT